MDNCNKRELRPILAVIMIAFLSMAMSAQAQLSGDHKHGSGGTNAAHQMDKPYLILISIDGFRWDYMDRYPTPNLDRIAATGSKVESLIPVFPTMTFPNHYSIATGLYPASHGLVSNNFPDKSRGKWYALHDRSTVEDPLFYSGEPIWVTAESQGMVAAAYYFVGTEAAIKGVSPTHWKSYDDDVSGESRVDQVLGWLGDPAQIRPHLYTLYFENVDDNSHWYGPDSNENTQAIKKVDSYVGRLLDGIEHLPYKDQINIIVVSDHGQGSYIEEQEPFILQEHIDLEGASIVEGGSYLHIYLNDDQLSKASKMVETINLNWGHGTAYLADSAPQAWKIDSNPRFPDIFLMPEPGYAVLSTPAKVGKINAGDHGWSPEAPDMHGFFLASGPNIKAGVELGAVRNVDIYPLMVSILDLSPPSKLDGKASRLSDHLIIKD